MKFTFSKEDLYEVFGQFGRVVDVELFDENECAQVTFQDFFEAWYAQQSLNGYFLANAGVNLLVKWLPASVNATSAAGLLGQISAGACGVSAAEALAAAVNESNEQMSTDKPEFQPSSKNMNAAVTNNATVNNNKAETTKFEQENIHSASAYMSQPQLQTSSQNFVPTAAPQSTLISSLNSFQPTSSTNTGNGM